uniref:Uncharacterized protein n=1 Tax=Lotharella globosa TaxID=91324 RepID=A0A7S4DIM3_9EUKA
MFPNVDTIPDWNPHRVTHRPPYLYSNDKSNNLSNLDHRPNDKPYCHQQPILFPDKFPDTFPYFIANKHYANYQSINVQPNSIPDCDSGAKLISDKHEKPHQCPNCHPNSRSNLNADPYN